MEKEARSEFVKLAHKAIAQYLKNGSRLDLSNIVITHEMKEMAGVFVSLKKIGKLRGCIGTFEPVYSCIAEEIINNAISSASHDPRFPQVTESELPEIKISVDILTTPESVSGPEYLDSTRYGVIVKSGDKKGLLLPDLKGVNSVESQIEICRMKAGIMPDEGVELLRFKVRRYT